MFCYKCGASVADKFCPSCGTPRMADVGTQIQAQPRKKSYGGKRILAVLGGLAVLAIIVNGNNSTSAPATSASTSTESVEKPSAAPAVSVVQDNEAAATAPIIISADALLKSFEENEAHAQSTYARKRLVLTGAVSQVFVPSAETVLAMAKKGLAAIPFVTMEAPRVMSAGETLLVHGISAHSEEGSFFGEQRAIPLEAGQVVTLACTFSNASPTEPTGYSIQLNDCMLQSDDAAVTLPADESSQPVSYSKQLASQPIVGSPTIAEIENTTYLLNLFAAGNVRPRPITFVGGKAGSKGDKAGSDTDVYEIDKSSIVFGNVSDLGQPVAVLVMDEWTGSSGVFRSLIAVWKANGTLVNSEQRLLGDRTVVNSISISNGLVTVDIVTQGPNEPMCCPTQREVLRLALQGNRFVEVQ